MWSCINEDCRTLLSQRLEKDTQLFFVEPVKVDSGFGRSIVKRKKLYGVAGNEAEGSELLLRPLFDEIALVSADAAVVKLRSNYALYLIEKGGFISDFEFRSFHCSDGMIILYKEKGGTCLFDLTRSDFIHKNGEYDEFNLKATSTEFIWARKGKFFDFIHRHTGRVVGVAGVVMPYDTDDGIWGLDDQGKVCCFTIEGTESMWLLREAVKSHGGHLTLHNYTYNIEHTIDVYGNVLNI